MKKQYCIILLVLSLLISCSSGNKEQTVSHKYIKIYPKSSIRLSEIAKSVELIPLEQTDQSNLGLVMKIIPDDDRYYLLDSRGYQERKVVVFDKKGKHLWTLDKRGGAPDEYPEARAISLTNEGELAIATYPDKVYYYDSNAEFIKKEKYETAFREIIINDKGELFSTVNWIDNTSPFRLFCDAEDSIHYFGKVSEDDYIRCSAFNMGNELHKYKNNLYYSYPFCDTIYNISDNNLNVEYIIDYDKARVPVEKIFKKNLESHILSNQLDNYSKCFYKNAFQISDNYVYIGSFDRQNKSMLTLHCKSTGNTLSSHLLVDDLIFPNNMYRFGYRNIPYAVEGDDLFLLIDPAWLMKGYRICKEKQTPAQWSVFVKRYPEIMDICFQLTEESNPVLMKIELKHF
ncbi:MAG: 6-bladed beta-propeller [Bacteroidales bacterium]